MNTIELLELMLKNNLIACYETVYNVVILGRYIYEQLRHRNRAKRNC